MDNRKKAEDIFLAGVRSVLPDQLIIENISFTGSILKIGELTFSTDKIGNIYVIGAGKASAAMGHYVESILGDIITSGHIVTKYGHACSLKKVKVTEAGHPMPDINGFRATAEILKIADEAGENDLVICLISGGGSSLMADLPDALFPEEIFIINNLLVKCGATIDEINTVRKHLSEVKGGQLACRASPAVIVNLILSDVIGNSPEVIASGPTVPDSTTFLNAYEVLERYNLINDITEGIKKYLQDGINGIRRETPKPGDPVFKRSYNIIIGTNTTALETAKKKATDSGFNTFIITDRLSGSVDDAVQSILDTALSYKSNSEIEKPVCLLYGGETTLKVTGAGLGGRNQHLALTAAVGIRDQQGVTLLSAGTDGNDGPTNAAGAVVDPSTFNKALSMNIEPDKFLREFDSYNFFKYVGGHIITGPTFTNVMDLVVVLIE